MVSNASVEERASRKGALKGSRKRRDRYGPGGSKPSTAKAELPCLSFGTRSETARRSSRLWKRELDEEEKSAGRSGAGRLASATKTRYRNVPAMTEDVESFVVRPGEEKS